MEYKQGAELYWDNLLRKLNCSMENIRLVQADFSMDPDYQAALQFANDEQRAQYAETCQICAYNQNLQYGLNQAVSRYITDHQNKVADAQNWEKKQNLEDDMKSIKKKISKRWWPPLSFIGLSIFIINFLIMLVFFIAYAVDAWCSPGYFCAGIFLLSTFFVIVSLALMFIYLPVYDIVYNAFLVIYSLVWFVIGCMDHADYFAKLDVLIYMVPLFIIPFLVFVSTFPFKFARRIKRDAMLEKYLDDMDWYDNACESIMNNYQDYMNGLFAEYSAKKSSPEAYLFLSQEAYDYRDYMQCEFAKSKQFFENKTPKG